MGKIKRPTTDYEYKAMLSLLPDKALNSLILLLEKCGLWAKHEKDQRIRKKLKTN